MLVRLRLLHRCAVRVIVACFFALAVSGAALSQSLSCPVTANTTVSGDTTLFTGAKPTYTCVVGNNAILTVPSGNALLNQQGVSGKSTTLILDSGTTLQNSGYVQNFATTSTAYVGGTLTSFGTIYNNGGGTLDTTDGTLTNAGNLENFGTIDDETGGGGTLNNAGRLVNETEEGGSFDVFIGVTTVTNAFKASIENDSTFESSSLTNNGTFTNTSGVLILTGPSTNNADGTIANGEFFSIYGKLQNNGTLTNSGGGTITVQNGGSLNLAGGSTLTNDTGIISVVPGGTLNNLTGGTLTLGGQIILDGTMNAGGGVQLQTAQSGGLFNSNPTTTLFGTGTINGNLTSTNSVVAPGAAASIPGLVDDVQITAPGTLTINGNYTQGSAGALDITIEGVGSGDFSVLDLSGLASLDGAVQFDFLNGFTPVVGDVFTFLNAGSLSGDFAAMSFTENFFNWNCPTADTCKLVYSPNSVSLDILAASTGGSGGSGGSGSGGGSGTTNAPEPSSLLLLGVALLALLACSRAKPGSQGLRF
jgi:hypothetical protein